MHRERKANAILLGFRTVRPIKLEFYDHPFNCPICNAAIVYTSLQTVIIHSTRLCPSCKGELVIQQGKVITAVTDRKRPKGESLSAKRSRR
jgi:hypothetical protein